MDNPSSDYPASDGEYVLVDSDLTESQLRDLYEIAEIRRFLHIFSKYVSEVKTADHEGDATPSEPESGGPCSPGSSRSVVDLGSFGIQGEADASSVFSKAEAGEPTDISAYIAEQYALPLLPAQRREIGPFTFSRTRLTLNRLYILAQIYWPYLRTLWDLAKWTNFGTSFLYCTVYWVLWWYNFLLPSFVLLVLAGLLRRGIFPYPSAEDLREHHRRLGQAKEFSDQFSDKLSPSSTIGFKELLRLYRLAHPSPNRKRKLKTKKSRSPSSESANFDLCDDSKSELNVGQSSIPDEATILDDPEETREALELRRLLLHFWTEIADLNERLRNIYIWRRPAASRRYTIAIALGFLMTALVPTQYLAKGFWLAVGTIFWHVTPVVCALSPSDRSRIPPIFADVPTDAEYAMELISSRVAKGEDLHTLRLKRRPDSPVKSPKFETPWKAPKGSHSKLKAIGKLISEEGTRAAKEAMSSKPLTVASHPLFSGAMAILQPDANTELHTYAGQHRSSPGLITLTMKRLIFTPVLSSQSKIEIDVERITGVKKNGVLKGLHVSHLKDSGSGSVVEEKFLWISGRDELFARLLAMGKKKWMAV